MKVCGFVYLSNHCHLLPRPRSTQQMADFMRDVNYKISREVGRPHHWEGPIWPRPYSDVQVSHEPQAQTSTLLASGVVVAESPRDLPIQDQPPGARAAVIERVVELLLGGQPSSGP